MGLLKMLSGTRSETGQVAGTLTEVFREGRNQGFGVFASNPLQQWMLSLMGAWDLRQEEDHSCPNSGRSSRSGTWLRNESD